MLIGKKTENMLLGTLDKSQIHGIILFWFWQLPFIKKGDSMWIFCKSYKNRWGKVMVASDYGYSAWRFWVPRKRLRA